MENPQKKVHILIHAGLFFWPGGGGGDFSLPPTCTAHVLYMYVCMCVCSNICIHAVHI